MRIGFLNNLSEVMAYSSAEVEKKMVETLIEGQLAHTRKPDEKKNNSFVHVYQYVVLHSIGIPPCSLKSLFKKRHIPLVLGLWFGYYTITNPTTEE